LVSNEAAEGPWDALDKVSAASILELVKNEPAGFLARLLQIRTWSWSDAVLENLGPLKRHQIEQLMREGLGPMGSALKESLLSTLLAHVGEERSNGALQSSIVSAEARKKTALSRLWVNVLSWLPGAASNRSEA
jgi:hypothetical protein